MDGENKNEGQGPMIGVVLVMAILIIGGVYMLFSRLNQNPAPSEKAVSGEVSLTGTSTDVNSLQSDAAKANPASLNDDLDNFDQATQ